MILSTRYWIEMVRYLAVAVLMSVSWETNGQQASEYQIKAAFIYNFVNFVEWPTSAFEKSTQPFVIAIAGTNVFGDALAEIVRGETYQGRPIQIKLIEKPTEAEGCQIIFISNQCTFTPELLTITSGKPVLTIADTESFLQHGGVLRFFLEESKVKIEVNLQKAINQNLQISSKLLRVAKIYNP